MARLLLPLPPACALAAAATALLLSCAAAQPAADIARGRELYETRCAGCHSIDANRVGPAHRGVVGRRSASASNYAYTPALRRLNVTWTRQTLDRWLTAPTTMAPGTAMGVSVAAAQDRADIIAYLETQR